MAIRRTILTALAGACLLLGGCRDRESGPIVISVVGTPPSLINPNLEPLTAPSAYLIEAVAQGLVRFDRAGQVEPALAQSWIVSDDGLRYTFRLARVTWPDGQRVKAEQVAARLRAAISRASNNPLKPVLGAIVEVEAMTDEVIEISLAAPRPNFLQLLAQPALGIVRNGVGTGPFRFTPAGDGTLELTLPRDEDEAAEAEPLPIVVRGETAALAVARFSRGWADLVTGGTFGDLAVVRAADPPAAALRFDPVAGLFGLAFAEDEGALGDAEVRRALAMAIDRAGLVEAMAVPDLQPRDTLVPPGIEELPAPARPGWAADPLEARREAARRIIAGAAEDGEEMVVRVALPDGPGYRLLFAYLRRDWRAIGVAAEPVAYGADADLRLIDAVAPANLSTWYLRRFTCAASPVCSTEADEQLDAARAAATPAERQEALVRADTLIMEASPFIPLAAPVRWSLVSERLTGFQPNMFGRHFAGALLAATP